MRIVIGPKQGHDLHFAFPTCMVCNSMSAWIIGMTTKKEEISLSPMQVRRLFQALHLAKRKYPDLKLVQVESANGDKVEVGL